VLVQRLAAQHGVGGFGQRGALARAQAAVLAKELRHHGIGRVVQAQHAQHQVAGGFEQGFGVHGEV